MRAIMGWVLACFWLALPLRAQAQQSVLPSFGDSRTGTSGLQFLKIAPDARSTGMAGAYLSQAGGADAVFWNPAGITRIDSGRKADFAGHHTTYFGDVDVNYGAAALRQSFTRYWGVTFTSLTSPEMDVTTEFQPDGTGQTYRYSNFALGLTYAQILTDQFSFGVTLKYAYEGFYNIETHNGLVDFGFQYDIGLQGIGFGVAVSNFGFNVRPDGSVQLLDVDGEPREGGSFEEVSAPASFRLGVQGDVLRNEDFAVVLNGQLNHPTDNNETYALGAEGSYKERFFLRTGYLFAADEDRWPSLGMGIALPQRFGALRFDYSFNNLSTLGALHRLGLGVTI